MQRKRQVSRFTTLWLSMVLFTGATQALGHEYWLDPLDTAWVVGQQLQAEIRNGQEFVGNALPFQPDLIARAGLISDTDRRSLSGRLGDYPAFQIPLQEAGLNLLLLETTRRELRYENDRDFETFLNYHGLQDIAERHRLRGLPRADIVEHYYRYCKSVIEVERQPDDDANSVTRQSPETPAAALGAQAQRLELVLQDNPMLTNSLRLQLLFEGVALAGRQVELFHRNMQGTVTRVVADTDDGGFVDFNAENNGAYLINSVKVVEPADSAAHWETLWASLSFRKNTKNRS